MEGRVWALRSAMARWIRLSTKALRVLTWVLRFQSGRKSFRKPKRESLKSSMENRMWSNASTNSWTLGLETSASSLCPVWSRDPVPGPNKNSVAMSRDAEKNSGCKSTSVTPSLGIARIELTACCSKRSVSLICALAKLGRSISRECCHSAPSEVKIPLPMTGTRSFFL